MASSTRDAYGDSPEVRVGTDGSGLTLTFHPYGKNGSADAAPQTTGKRTFKSGIPEVIGSSDGSVVVLAVHDSTGDGTVSIEFEGQKLTWAENQLHNAHKRAVEGEIILTYNGKNIGQSDIAWSLE